MPLPLASGIRIVVPSSIADRSDPLYGVELHGTIAKAPSPIPSGSALVCMDIAHHTYSMFSKICGNHHGKLVDLRYVKLLSDTIPESRKDHFKHVPRHIGVFALDSFSFENRSIPKHVTGRPICASKHIMVVEWFMPPHNSDILEVPREKVDWCRMNPTSYAIRYPWPKDSIPLSSLSPGDLLVYDKEKPLVISVPSSTHNCALTRGTILRYSDEKAETGYLNAVVTAGASTEALGVTVRVRRSYVSRFREPFIARGQKVEVVAEILFKKKNLIGQRGMVVLATDFEGDIGIEFPQNIGAGSLDGVGKEGRCLYLPAEAVKITSE